MSCKPTSGCGPNDGLWRRGCKFGCTHGRSSRASGHRQCLQQLPIEGGEGGQGERQRGKREDGLGGVGVRLGAARARWWQCVGGCLDKRRLQRLEGNRVADWQGERTRQWKLQDWQCCAAERLWQALRSPDALAGGGFLIICVVVKNHADVEVAAESLIFLVGFDRL